MKQCETPTPKSVHARLAKRKALWLTFLVVGVLWPQFANALPIARLRRVEPTVQMRHKSVKSWVVARERGAVVYGDTIQTGTRGKADILFANGTKVAMRARSSIEIIAPSNPNNPLIIRVFGALSEVFVRPRGNTQVRTAAAIAAARGTEFLVRLPDELSTQVIVSEGSVDFANEQGTVLIQENQSSYARVGQAPAPPVAVDVTGELAWTADITGLPLEWRTSFSALDDIQNARVLKIEAAAARANPDDFAVQMRWGKANHDAGEYSNAAEIFTQLTAKQPNNADAWIALSRAERSRGAGQQALAAAQRAQEVIAKNASDNSVESAEAIEQIALSYIVIGDLKSATRVLVAIRDTPRGQAVSALIALRERRVEDAITDFRAALSSSLLQNDASLRSVLAMALLSRNDTADALLEARRAVRDAPRFADAHGVLASALFFKGERVEASTSARRALQLNDESPLALLASGRLLLAAGNVDEARDFFSRAHALFPSPLTATEVGDSYLRLRQWHKAETFYRRALQLAPDYAPAQSGLGMSLQQQGQTVQAAAALQRARVLDPQKSLNRARLAQLYIETGDLERAAQELPDGFQLPRTPENAVLLVRLSELNLLRENLFDALEFARRAVVLQPQSGLTHYQLGRVYLEMGRAVQAEQQFRQAVILDSELAAARFALGYVRDLIGTGRDISRPSAILNGVNLGASSRAFGLQNLRTPGVEERIQASLIDPSVARTATRAVGNTQFDGIVSTERQNDAAYSYLDESADRSALLGITASRIQRSGLDENSDSTVERVGISFGKNNRENNRGLFFTAGAESSRFGLDTGELDETTALSRAQSTRPDAIIGGYVRHGQNQRTRFLLRGTRIDSNTTAPDDSSARDENGHSFNLELRHDWNWKSRHKISAGFNIGKSRRTTDLFLLGIPFFFSDLRIRNGSVLNQQSFYIRDEAKITDRLTITGELQRKRIRKENFLKIIEPDLPQLDFEELNKLAWEPKVIVDFQPNSSSGFRVRAQRVVGDSSGYELLTPTDLFSPSLPNLPQLATGGQSRELEAEAYHTFGDSSFLRFSLFNKNMQDTREASFDGASGAVVPLARIRGARIAYEGSLGSATFFTSLSSLNGHDVTHNRELAFVPRVQAEAGLQWLRRDGWFLQPSWLYQGARIVPREAGDVRDKRPGFQIFNARIGKRQGLQAVYFVEVVNIFNQPFDVLGIEQPKRRFRFGATRRF